MYMEEKEFQEKLLVYRILESRLDALMRQRDLVASKLVEIQTTLASVDELGKSKETVLFPIGAEAFTFAKIADKNKLIVGIGANVAMDKTIGESKKILNERRVEMEEALDNIQKEIHQVMRNLEILEPEIQKLATQRSQQNSKAG